ncbi:MULTISPECIES: response regulator [Enterobacteriaceae]|uniref:response regulator n=2 Tax=Enterobacterales TaxID=91347 RepID=UPI0006DBC2F9|nr:MULTISPECIES: response regulator [Enterobacteriaceae]OCO57278.1 histidine kinase [Citrobacter freundii]MCW4845602.1 response regulator [Enterobacter hormaechei subsp. xiangfangensis]MCW4859726.1 response regulator [Enterobacter mori]MDM3377321.1 response regulator [Citrobacter sp. Cb010]MDM3457217.1 response regulator [Citrobacter sp. Cb036]
MKILLVEDEVHKRDELIQCVKTVYDIDPQIVDCVNDAVLAVINEDYDLIILDMALSTFSDSSGDNKKGHDQAQGGIEVLRALNSRKKETKIIIVTQYPDFYIGGVKVKLQNSIKVVKEKYNQNMIGAVLYTYKSKPTLQKIISILRKNS